MRKLYKESMNHFVEIRSYNLKPNTRDQFHQLFLEQALPMLQRWNVDVVAFGASPHDKDSYYLIRCYESLTHREQSQDAFYGSDEWKQAAAERLALARAAALPKFPIETPDFSGDQRQEGDRAGRTASLKILHALQLFSGKR